ncbi:MAG: ferritin family protein [Candidatus Bipolaricaulia bacterium]
MDDRRLLPLLEDALRAERDGYEFYTMAAEKSEDVGAVKVFEHLAEEERRHFGALQMEYRAILDGSGWDPSVVLGERWRPQGASGIFSEDFRRRIEGRHLEMSALSIGILLEKSAHVFYADAAEAEKDEAVRRFFGDLADWENEHYQLLLREDSDLRDEYWSESRFAPLS